MSGGAGHDLGAVDGARTVVEAYFATLPLEVFRALIRASAEGDVNIRVLLELAALCDPRVRVSDELRSLGHEFYSPLLARWKTQNPGKRLTLLPGLQAYVLLTPGSDEKRDRKSSPDQTPPVGDVTINLQPLADPGFDWSEAQAVLHQIDEIGESAKLWIHDAAERRPHLERVYGLAFQLLKAVERESLRVSLGAPLPDSGFDSTLMVLKSDVDRAQRQFQRSAVQTADRVYLRGMVRRGLAILFLLCGALARNVQ